jgi:hypothetical protein
LPNRKQNIWIVEHSFGERCTVNHYLVHALEKFSFKGLWILYIRIWAQQRRSECPS